MNSLKKSISEIDFYRIKRLEALDYVMRHHHRKSLPAVCWSFALAIDNRVVGIVVYSTPNTPAISNFLKKKHGTKKCLQLSRLVLLDNAPKNSASYLVSRSVKWIRCNLKQIDTLVTYCETKLFLGTVYKASNWILDGKSTHGGYEGYVWNETFIYPKWGSKNLKQHCGLEKIPRQNKHRYIYHLKKHHASGASASQY